MYQFTMESVTPKSIKTERVIKTKQDDIFRSMARKIRDNAGESKMVRFDTNQLNVEDNGIGSKDFRGITKPLISKVNKDVVNREFSLHVSKSDAFKEGKITKYSKAILKFK